MNIRPSDLREKLKDVHQLLDDFEGAYNEMGAAMDARPIVDEQLVMGPRQYAARERYSRLHGELHQSLKNLSKLTGAE